jgi:hypothetical protein
MDTFKDRINFDRMDALGNCPWKIWLPATANPGITAGAATTGR